MTDVDVLIIGAGLSGIDAAVHLGRDLPGTSFALLEQRGELGGTWSLFRYPGLRSDSDMYTLGYPWRPWTGRHAIADGHEILAYLRETAAEHGVDRHIRYHRRATRLEWSSDRARWTVTVEDTRTGAVEQVTCRFVVSASGYYRYEAGYTPHFPGIEDYAGTVVHPQHWPADLDHRGKRVVVIGSGATAISLVPALAQEAGHVTMLQRTPTYVLSLPRVSSFAERLKRMLPPERAARLIHARFAATTFALFEFCRRRPALARRVLRRLAQRHLPADFDYDTHLDPPYDPWVQRLCVVPDADLFRAIGERHVEVVTDHIETFTEKGIRLRSGTELEADLVVTATGLELLPLGGVELRVDGRPVVPGETFAYKGMMLAGVPNLAFVFGYENASWTLRADLVCEYVVRLLRHLADHGHRSATPRAEDGLASAPMFDLKAGYWERSGGRMPRAGDRDPWRIPHNWYLDRRVLRRSPVDDGVMEFS